MTSSETSSSYRAASTGSHHLVGIEVLVLDGDRSVHAGIAQLLSEAHLHVTCVSDPERAHALVERQFFSVALVDIDTPAPRAGIATIRAIKQASPTSMVIALTPRRSSPRARFSSRGQPTRQQFGARTRRSIRG